MAEIFDLFTLFGLVPPQGSPEPGAKRLREMMARYGVGAAVTVSTRAVFFDAVTGNEEMRRLCAEAGMNLTPGAVLDPRLPRAETFATGARLLCLLPETQRWPTDFAPVNALLRRLSGAGPALPILWEVSRPGDATIADRFLRESGYAGSVVFAGVTGTGLVEALTVAAGSERYLLATNGLRGIGEVELAVQALGPQRVLFASGAPALSLGAAVALIRQARLGPENEALVLGENARRLLSGALPAGTGMA